MKLSKDIIFYHLSKDYPIRYAVETDTNKKYERPVIYEKGIDLTGFVVVGNSKNLSKISESPEGFEGNLFICVDEIPTAIKNAGFPVIIFDNEVSSISVFNKLQRVFSQFDNWDEELRSIVFEGKSFVDLINSCDTVVSDPMALVDKDLHYAAFSNEYLSEFIIPDKVGEDLSVPWKYVTDIVSRKDHQKIFSVKEVFLFSFTEVSCNVIGKSIFYKEEYVGHIGIVLKRNTDYDYYESILEHLHYYADKLYSKYNSFGQTSDAKSTIYNLMEKRLKGEDVTDKLWDMAYKEVGWERGSRLQLVQFRPSSRYDKNLYAKNLSMEIKHMWSGIVSFDNNDQYFLIVNLNLFHSFDKKDFYQSLAYFLRESLLIAGLSRIFQDMTHLPSAYRQADAAINIGREKAPTMWYYKFDDYALSYIIKNGTGLIEKEHVCSSKLLTLKMHDAEKNTEYYKTLMTYFQCMFNATVTAKKLFIQRSTFLYRMDRIQELVDIDFASYNEIRYLYFSFSVLEGI